METCRPSAPPVFLRLPQLLAMTGLSSPSITSSSSRIMLHLTCTSLRHHNRILRTLNLLSRMTDASSVSRAVQPSAIRRLLSRIRQPSTGNIHKIVHGSLKSERARNSTDAIITIRDETEGPFYPSSMSFVSDLVPKISMPSYWSEGLLGTE